MISKLVLHFSEVLSILVLDFSRAALDGPGARFRPAFALALGLREDGEGANVLEHLRRDLPRLHAWCAAALARPSAVATFHEAEMAAVKARAVATYVGTDGARAGSGASGKLEALLLLRPTHKGAP